jgi:branched-chain amino acid transport system permease protein
MDVVAQILVNTVIAGAIYSLTALGFNLIFGTAKFFDLGYGAIAAVGGYGVFYLYKQIGLPLAPSIFMAIVGAALIGLLIESFIYRPLRDRKSSNTVMIIASLGVLTAVQAIIAMIFTSQFQTLSKDLGSEKTFNFFGGVMTETQLIILAVALAVMCILAAVLKYTRFGKAVRAIADDEEVASIVGINSKRMMAVVFFIGYAIAAMAGIAIGFDTGIQPTMGLTLLLKGVIASIIGGVGNIFGGVLGAFLLSLVENLGAWQVAGEWKDAIAFAVLIIFLLFRPQGIFGKK